MGAPLVCNNNATLAILAQRRAITKLAPGPASATSAISRRGFLRLLHVTGTGFAQPNMKVKRDRIIIATGKIMVTTRSMCFSGFSVTLPSINAVLSPNLLATQPCAASCNVIPKISGNAIMANLAKISDAVMLCYPFSAIPQVHYVATYCFRKQKIETVGDYQGGALRAPP